MIISHQVPQSKIEQHMKDHSQIFIGSMHGGLITTLVARQVDRSCFNPLENFIWPNEPQIKLPFLPNLITFFIGEIFKKHIVANHELDLLVPLVQNDK